MVIQVALRNKAKESATILDSSFLPAYKDSIKRYGPTLRAYLDKFGQEDTQLAGSSPIMNVYLQNSGLLPADARLATREDLEITTSRAKDFLRGVFTDFGLALRTPGDSYKPNDLLAEVLAEELDKRKIKLGRGKLILLNALSLQEDKNSAYGAVFKLNDKAGKDTVLDLENFKWSWTRNEGLACAGLYWSRCWSSNGGRLGDSSGCGRVVVVSGEATSQKILDRYASKFKEDKDKAIAKAREDYKKGKSGLRAA